MLCTQTRFNMQVFSIYCKNYLAFASEEHHKMRKNVLFLFSYITKSAKFSFQEHISLNPKRVEQNLTIHIN